MSVRTAGLLLGIAAIAIAAWGLWSYIRHPLRVLATGSMQATDPRTGKRLTLPTRDVAVGYVTKRQVQLPNGTWLDCGSDCADTLKREVFEFWDQPERKG